MHERRARLFLGVSLAAGTALGLWAGGWTESSGERANQAPQVRPGPLSPAPPVPAARAPGGDSAFEAPIATQESQRAAVTAASFPSSRTEGTAPALGLAERAERALAFRGRAVSGQDGLAIPGARVLPASRAGTRDEPLARADAAGELRIDGVNAGELLALEADGFGPGLFVAAIDARASESVRSLELLPACALAIRLLGASDATGEVLLVVRAARADLALPDERAFVDGELSWSAAVEQGAARIDALPARVPLSVELHAGGELRRLPAPLVLEPGEERVVDWRRVEGLTLAGRAVDEGGAGVAGLELWLARSTSARSAHMAAYFEAADAERVAASATTDSDGRFRFDELAPGRYWIGPALVDAQDASPLAIPVELHAGEEPDELVLSIVRGHWIEGRVERADGEPVERALVWAQCEAVAGPSSAWADADGRFRVGPLFDAEHRLVARSFDGGAARTSAELAAEPGARDVVLRFVEGGALEGEVVDPATGERCAARIALACVELASFTMIESASGSFRFDGLAPQRYVLCAHTDSGLVALVRDVEVRAGAPAALLRLELEPGASLRIERRGGSEHASVQVRIGGALVQFAELAGDAARVVTVPPGELEIELAPRGAAVETRSIVLAPGEERTLEFAASDRAR